MYFKRPKFKYGGEVEGLEKVRRQKYQAAGSVQPGTQSIPYIRGGGFSFMNPFRQGIGRGFQENEQIMYDDMPRPKPTVYEDEPQYTDYRNTGQFRPTTGMEFLSPSYQARRDVKASIPDYDDMPRPKPTVYEDEGIGQVKKKMQPGPIDFQILGRAKPFAFMSPRAQLEKMEQRRLSTNVEKGLGETTMEEIKKTTPMYDEPGETKDRSDLVKAGIITPEEKNLLEGKAKPKETAVGGVSTEKAGKDDFEISDNLAKKKLLMSGKVLTDEEEKDALSGKAIPMYEKYLGPQEAETKRRAWLNVAKLGFRLMNKDVAEAGLESAADFEKVMAEEASLKRLAALKGLDYEKDVKIASLKLAAKEPSAYKQKMATFKEGLLNMYPSLKKHSVYADGLVNTFMTEEGPYNPSVGKRINRDADFLLAQQYGGVKPENREPDQYLNAIAKFALVDPKIDVRSNLREIPLKGDKLDTSFQLIPGNYYFSKGLNNGFQIYEYTGKEASTVGEGSKQFKEYTSPFGVQYR